MKQQPIIKNAKWELFSNSLLLPVPILVFIKDFFETKELGPYGWLLFFAYLTHLKDCLVIFGVAIPDSIRAINVMREHKPEHLLKDEDDEHDESPLDLYSEEPVYSYSQEAPGVYVAEPEVEYEIDDVPQSKRTTLRVLCLNLVITADALFFVLVLPQLKRPETSWEKAVTALTILNHSSDAVILFTKYIRYDTPLYTQGKRVLKEYVLPATLLAGYAAFLFGFQRLGGTDEKGNPLYSAVDYDKNGLNAALMSGGLAIGMPLINKIILLCCEKLQQVIHDSAPTQFGRGICQRVRDLGSNLSSLLSCRPCRRALSSSNEQKMNLNYN